MTYRDLTIRVFGDFTNRQYAGLAYEVRLRLEANALGDRAILVTDGKISGVEMEAIDEPSTGDN